MVYLKYNSVKLPVLDNYNIAKSSQEITFSDLKCDFTGHQKADLPEKYQEVMVVEESKVNREIEKIEYEEKKDVKELSFESKVKEKISICKVHGYSKQETRSGKNKVDFINYAETIFDSSKVERLNDGSYKFKHCDTVYTLFEGLVKAPCTLSWYARNDGTTTTTDATFNFKILYEDGTSERFIYTTSPDFSLQTRVLTKNVIKIVNTYIGTSPLTIIKDVQLEEGSKATEYEQYGTVPSEEFSSPIQNTGNNINILNKNNIFTRNGVKTETLETGIRIIDTSQSKFEYVGILLGGKELLEKNITCYSDVFKDKNIYSNAELYFGKASAPTSGGIIQKQNVSSSITWNIPSSFPNGSDQISIYLYISGGNPPSSGYSVDYTNLKVEIGDTPTDYSPYGLGNISTVISNKNVFNLKRLIEMSSKYSKIENGYKFLSTARMYSKGISCLYPISLPISMSYKIQNLTGTGFRFKFWFDNGETESLNAYSSGTSSEETSIVINNYTKSRCKTNCKNRY